MDTIAAYTLLGTLKNNGIMLHCSMLLVNLFFESSWFFLTWYDVWYTFN